MSHCIATNANQAQDSIKMTQLLDRLLEKCAPTVLSKETLCHVKIQFCPMTNFSCTRTLKALKLAQISYIFLSINEHKSTCNCNPLHVFFLNCVHLPTLFFLLPFIFLVFAMQRGCFHTNAQVFTRHRARTR